MLINIICYFILFYFLSNYCGKFLPYTVTKHRKLPKIKNTNQQNLYLLQIGTTVLHKEKKNSTLLKFFSLPEIEFFPS